jgi:hypothetical protein
MTGHEESFCTEDEARQVLYDICYSVGQDSPFVMVARREQKSRSLRREVTFVIRTKEGDEKLIDSLIKWGIENSFKLEFFLSELNLQNENLTADYIYVRCFVAPDLS